MFNRLFFVILSISIAYSVSPAYAESPVGSVQIPTDSQLVRLVPLPSVGETPEVTEKIEQLKAMLDKPGVKAVITAVSDPQLQNAAQAILASPDLKRLGGFEFGWFLFILFFRSWRLGTARSWLGRIWVGMYCSAGYFAGASIAIPLWVLGTPYRDLLLGFFRVARQAFGGI